MDVSNADNKKKQKRIKTETSNFGVGHRENHDATAFYAQFPPPIISNDEEIRSCEVTNQLFCRDSRDMSIINDNCVALVVTSPPYFAAKEYEEALGEGHTPASYIEYLQMLREVFTQCYRVLEPGGRIAINVANLGRRPYRALTKDVWNILEELQFLPRGEIVWSKASGASGSCAWGSWRSPSNPILRDLTERILVASKARFDRALHWKVRKERGHPWESTISRDDFLAATLDTWHIQPVSAKRIGHPAPFPIELPKRLMELYTFKNDIVLDPFIGAGTTALAALETERKFLGFDTEAAYIELAETRINQFLQAKDASKND